MKKHYLKLINDEEIAELSTQVFNSKLADGSDTFTDVLSEEEEIAFMQKLLTKDGAEADPWLEFIQGYNRHYPVCNKAIDVLFQNLDNSRNVALLIDLLSAHGYNERQGLAVCDLVWKLSDQDKALLLIQLIYECGRFFSSEIYQKLMSIDARVRERNGEQIHFAESYRQAVENHQSKRDSH